MTYYPSVVTDRADATGTRDAWTALLARLTIGFARGIPADGSPAWSRLPDADPANRITGMEGFCRMSVAWSAWLAEPGNPVTLEHDGRTVDVLDLVVRGLVHGTDPAGPWYWGDIRDRDQRIVEAAELAFTLWTGRDRILPALGTARLRGVLAWLAQVHGRDVYADNWVLFPAIVATVCRGLGEPVDDRLIDEGIDRMLAWYRDDGWYSDGAGHAFDRYTGWAIHWHLLHWAEVDGDRRPDVRDLVVERARTWLRDLPALAADDGAIPFLGRSLGYRFATAGPLGLAAMLGQLPVDPGLARGLIDRSIRYHLAHDAIDATTDWFRVGVWGRRPDVCERYMSAGASAWAVRALVPLSLPASHPFWSAADPGLPGSAARPIEPAVDLVLRGPGYLVGRRPVGGGTWVASGLMDHPDDIPGHDYRPSYGKWLFHSEFPYTDHAADGRPGPDGTVVLEGPRGGIGHRELVDTGGAGADWIWSRYQVAVDGVSHGVSVVSIRVGDAWARAVGLRANGPVRAVTASLPLGVADPAQISRVADAGARTEAATDGTRWVAIRALAGYDRVTPSGPARGGPDRNLVAEHSEQPSVEESAPSAQTRLLAHIDVCRSGGGDPRQDLAAMAAESPDVETLILRPRTGEVCRLSVGPQPPTLVELDGWTVTGPALHVVRIGPDGSWLAGEAIERVQRGDTAILSMDQPGPVEVRRLGDGSLLVGTSTGLTLGAGWAPAGLGGVQVLEADGWADAGALATERAIDPALVRHLSGRTGHEFVWLRLVAR
jgi:hypothetical protein